MLLQQIIRDHASVGECMYPNNGGRCPPIIKSHTIQRRGPLTRIIDADNHVSTLQLDRTANFQVNQIGWKFASTFPGFCAEHDSLAFRPVENEPFASTLQQCFLLGFRAISYELQRKTAMTAAQPRIRELMIFERGEAPEEQELFHFGTAMAAEELTAVKRLVDDIYVRQAWGEWSSLVLTFRGNLGVVTAGSLTPTYDLVGRVLQDRLDSETPLGYITVGFVDVGDDFAIVIGWPIDSKSDWPSADQSVKSRRPACHPCSFNSSFASRRTLSFRNPGGRG